MSDIFEFQTRINPSWLAVGRLQPSFLRIDTPFPLMNLMARQKGVTAAVESNLLVLTVAPGDPPVHLPPRQLDLLALLQRHADAMSLLEAIRTASPPPQQAAPKQAAPRRPSATPGKRTRGATRAANASPEQVAPVVSVPIGPILATARPEDVWEAIRAHQGEPFTIAELQATLGASVGPYVIKWARDGFLTKAGRDPDADSLWRYRLHRDQPTHPPV